MDPPAPVWDSAEDTRCLVVGKPAIIEPCESAGARTGSTAPGPSPEEQLLQELRRAAEAAPAARRGPEEQDAALRNMAALLGPELVQRLAAAAAAATAAAGPAPQHLSGFRPVQPYRARCVVHTVSVKVHTEEHAAGSSGWQRIARMLINCISQVARRLVAAAEDGVHVHATCVQGCIQLLAQVSIPATAGGGSEPPSSTCHDMAAAVQKLVGSQLEALHPGRQPPALDVAVSAPDSCKEVPAAGLSAQLLACSPPCLAAGAGSSELQLLINMQQQPAGTGAGAVAGATHEATSSAAVGPTRFVVWDSNAAAPMEAEQHMHSGPNMITLQVPTPQHPRLLHLALLLPDHSLAFVQPLLVLPAAAAAELKNLWASAVLHAASQGRCSTKLQQSPHQHMAHQQQQERQQSTSSMCTAVASAWHQVAGPLVTDLAYAVGAANATAVDARRKPCLGGEAASAHQELMVHLLGYLYSGGMWAMLQYVCSAAGAAGRAAGRAGSPQTTHAKAGHMHQRQRQRQQQMQQQMQDQCQQWGIMALRAQTSGSIASRAVQAARRRWPTEATALALTATAAARTASAFAALLLLPFVPFIALHRLFVGQTDSEAAQGSMRCSSWAAGGAGNARVAASFGLHGKEAPAGVVEASQPPLLALDPASQQLATLLFGFRQPGLEHAFLQYMYQQTAMLDACAAVFYPLMAAANMANFPAAAWQEPSTQLSLLVYLLGYALPSIVLLRLRRHLGPGGRELGVLLVEFAMALQVLGMGLGVLAAPPVIIAHVTPKDGIADDVLQAVGCGVMRAVLSQARLVWFAPAFTFYMLCASTITTACGMPVCRSLARAAAATLVALAIAAAQEARARKSFLHLLPAGGATGAFAGAKAKAGSPKKCA